MTLFGIDVSNHQRNFDFAAAKREAQAFLDKRAEWGTVFK